VKIRSLDPYQKFCCCSVVGSNPTKIKCSGPLSEVLMCSVVGSNPAKIRSSGPLSEVLMLFCCWEQPYKTQKFWFHIISSDVECNPVKVRSSSLISGLLVFVVMVFFELDLYILTSSQSNHYPLTPSRPQLQKTPLKLSRPSPLLPSSS
jgi:hypothetical protein